MSQITSGIRAILSHPAVYDSFQSLLGTARGCELFAADDLRIQSGQTVLDIGCGTADMLAYLPNDITYIGYDISKGYIESARKRFQDHSNAQFKHGLLDQQALASLPKIDVAYTSGVLHHLDDGEAGDLCALVVKALKKDGRFISVDPCYIENQNFLSKFLITCDRGQNVRRPEELEALAKTHFNKVEVRHRNDFLRIPYDHAVMECFP